MLLGPTSDPFTIFAVIGAFFLAAGWASYSFGDRDA